MKIEINRSVVTLPRDGLIAIRDAAHIEVICQSGNLWVTQEGEVKDVILGPGDRFSLRKRGLTLITALNTSAFNLVEGELPRFNMADGAYRNKSVGTPVTCS